MSTPPNDTPFAAMMSKETIPARPVLDHTSTHTTNLTKSELDLKPAQREARLQVPSTFAKEILFLAVICSSRLLTQAGLAMSIVPSHTIGKSFDVQN